MIDSSKLQIPSPIFDYCFDKVVKMREDHKVTPYLDRVRTTEKVPHPSIPNRLVSKTYYKEVVKLRYSATRPLFGAGCLNFIAYNSLGGFDYVEARSTPSKAVFNNSFSLQDFVVDISTDRVVMSHVGGAIEKEYSIKKTNRATKEVTYVTRTFTASDLMEELGVTLEVALGILNSRFNTFQTYIALPTTSENELANAFSTLSLENGVVSGDLLINGNSWDTFSRFGDIIFPFGKAGQDFVVDWVLYNEHSDDTPDWTSEGNFGEAARVRISEKSDAKAFSVNVATTDGEASYNSETHTFYYNPTKGSVLAIMPTLKPAQGKNDDYECLIDLNTGEVYYNRFKALNTAKGIEVVPPMVEPIEPPTNVNNNEIVGDGEVI